MSNSCSYYSLVIVFDVLAGFLGSEKTMYNQQCKPPTHRAISDTVLLNSVPQESVMMLTINKGERLCHVL